MNKYLDYKNTILDNGIEVVTVKKETDLVSLINAVKVGSFYEKEDEKGISHFIEHMLFKGTDKRDNKEIIKDIENTGGEYDAYTDNDSTVLSFTALREEFEKGCDIFSDMLINSTFKEAEIKKERKVILSEIKNSYDDIEDLSYRKIKEQAFPEGILKFDVLGTEERVRSFNRDDILDFYKKYYVTTRTKIIVVSSMEHEAVLEVIKKYYGSWEKRENKDMFSLKDENTSGENEIDLPHNEQSTVMYLYVFEDASKEEELALRIIDYKLGSGGNSILFKELREDRGLCYAVHSNLTNYKEYNILYVYASVSNEDIQESKEVIKMCIEDFAHNKLQLEEGFFETIKKVYKTEIASTKEGCNDLANFILGYILDGEDIMSFYKDLDLMDKLQREDIVKVAEKLFKDPTISIIKGRNVEDEGN